MPAPPYPWKKGKHESYSCFVIEVEVAVDQFGHMWSNHKLQSQDDHDLTREMPSGGMEYVAHSLLCEMVKREAILEVLMRLGNDPEFKGRILDSAPEAQDRLLSDVTAAMLEVIQKATGQIGPEAARAALDMVRRDSPDE